MRKKRAHILWQPITRKKRKLPVNAHTTKVPTRIGEAPISTKSPNTNFELAKSSSTIQATYAQDFNYADTHPIPYDEYLLERSITQWQFGDWESLANLNVETIKRYPDRAKLALLAAAGNLQTKDSNAARQYIQLAQGWGCSKKQICQILIAGVHNSLGRAAAINGQQTRALRHFENTIAVGMPGAEQKLICQARIREQYAQLGMSPTQSRQHINNISYARSPDNGKNWPSSRQRPHKQQITQAYEEIINPVSPSSNLFNLTSIPLNKFDYQTTQLTDEYFVNDPNIPLLKFSHNPLFIALQKSKNHVKSLEIKLNEQTKDSENERQLQIELQTQIQILKEDLKQQARLAEVSNSLLLKINMHISRYNKTP